MHLNTVINLFSALCAKLFQNGGKFFKYFFFLLSAHFNKLLYIEGKVKHQRKAAYKQLLPLNSYGEALQVKNERFCRLFKLPNKGMNQ